MSYEDLGSYSSSVSYGILKWSEDREILHNHEQIKYILKSCKEINNAFDRNPTFDASSSSRLLNVLRYSFESLWNGQKSGEELIKADKGLWADVNKNWLMGDYCLSLRNFLDDYDFHRSNALEINSEIGATSDLISHKFNSYLRTGVRQVRRNDFVIDFERDIKYFDTKFDIVLGTNSLDRFLNKELALKNIYEVLKDDGKAFFVEGEAFPANKPFVLNNAFGLLDGWWNTGGFLELDQWMQLFDKTGFEVSDLIQIVSDDTIVIGNIFILEKR